jgi:glycosyltransferase involved in cell wall biosynthesis
MRICILSAYEDSMQKDTGASVRIYNLAKGLASTGNKVNVVLPKYRASSEFVDKISVYGLNGFCPSGVLKVIGKVGKIAKPSALYFFDFLFALRASRYVQKADIVQIEQPALSILLTAFIQRTLKKPVAIDCHDVFQALRVKHTGLVRRVLETFLEKIAYKNANLLLTVSGKEKELLVSMGFSRSKIVVVPNGVNTENFKRSGYSQEIRKKYRLDGSRIVVFVGNLEYLPNREAIELISSMIAPKVREEVQDVKFLVVGKIRGEMQLPGITFTGFVDNVADLLAVSDVGIAPLLQGSGTRLKILEYFSSGVPVVSTSVGAEGLRIENGHNIFIHDNLENFAAQIIILLKDKELSLAVGDAGRAVAANYDWNKITEKLETDFRSFLSEYRASADCA